jgi:DNA (cytosine-5)-methyltransferase 1
MKYLSVCSGIEAATVAWEPLGFEASAFSEIDPFACALLERKYPAVDNLGDMNEYGKWPELEPDILVGGTPCQSFSIVGRRAGLDDPRGNLALVFLGIAKRYRPRWFVWENVPGVLSSGGGADIRCFLAQASELGYGLAYRILDARYFGVPQSRRRVFVVGYLGDWRRAAAVLFQRTAVQSATTKDGKPWCRKTSFRHGTEEYDQGRFPVGSQEVAGSLRKHMGSGRRKNGSPIEGFALYADAVRYLTPVEYERLQGFPDGYTCIPFGKYTGDGLPDKYRYAALGNSMAVPVMHWIGQRIKAVDAIKKSVDN